MCELFYWKQFFELKYFQRPIFEFQSYISFKMRFISENTYFFIRKKLSFFYSEFITD